MIIHLRTFVHFTLATALLLSMTACNDNPLPVQIEVYCVSDSGLSRYWLSLNTSERSGMIRYNFQGQDAQYVVRHLQIDGRKLIGRADFDSSSTGETRGSPILFSYDSGTNSFTDGSFPAKCQNSEMHKQG